MVVSHLTLVVTAYDGIEMQKERDEVVKIMESYNYVHGQWGLINFGSLVSPVVKSVVNGINTFFIAPDGSPECWGWELSSKCESALGDVIAYLDSCDYFDYVLIRFGGDEDDASVVKGNDSEYHEELWNERSQSYGTSNEEMDAHIDD